MLFALKIPLNLSPFSSLITKLCFGVPSKGPEEEKYSFFIAQRVPFRGGAC